ncbi:UPF0161 protein At3g09310 isoform X1 [Hevea brasiliensis]|uniref:UPF0161 protein At3g09310 isoform X1 n=1 Tax=Hevea brasiliensis TaxID=3981 RepID=UPI0025EF2E03|nr:UPF0161 protein At3g09310 isoform X1 [Hevea brasiliensis]XP_021641143.2 UPF0161 protein At3g09310 isoform X1 [Hevea brasiliensis]
MASLISLNSYKPVCARAIVPQSQKADFNSLKSPSITVNQSRIFSISIRTPRARRCISVVVNKSGTDSHQNNQRDEEANNLGVKAALSMLRFYKREISPLLPKSCRYVPTCSEYSMIAYKKYGVVKGTILTGWRLCRCNPLGGSGFDPPRWFDEQIPPEDDEIS